MFKNEVTLLKKENAGQLEALKDENRYIIKSIMKSMSIFKVNSYDAQVIQRDLIGMAQEAELRDSSIEKSIGIDIKGFVNEILDSSARPSKIEILLGFLIKLSGMFFLSFIILTIGAYSGGLAWKANSVIFLLYGGMSLVSFIIDGLITPIFSIEKGLKKDIPALITMFSFFILIMISFRINTNISRTQIYAWQILIASGLIYIVCNCLNVKNIKKLSKDKKNYIDDLINKQRI